MELGVAVGAMLAVTLKERRVRADALQLCDSDALAKRGSLSPVMVSLVTNAMKADARSDCAEEGPFARRAGATYANALMPSLQVGRATMTRNYYTRDERATLLQGGTGAIGRVVAAMLLSDAFAGPLVLTGRSGRASRISRGGIVNATTLVAVIRMDGASSEEACQLAGSGSPWGRTGAILLCSGVARDGAVTGATPSSWRISWAAKVVAARRALESARHTAPIARIVGFSSAAVLVSNPGQCAYAAANAALDAHVALTRMQGTCASTSIQWGPWAHLVDGMASAAVLKSARAAGVGVVSPEQGLALVRAVIRRGISAAPPAILAASSFAWDKHLPLPSFRSSLFAQMTCATDEEDNVGAATTSAVPAMDFIGMQRGDQVRIRQMLERIPGLVAEAVGGSVVPSLDAPLMDAGVDSLAATALSRSLEELIGVPMPATLVFDFPTTRHIMQHASDLLLPAAALMSAGTGTSDVAGGDGVRRRWHVAAAAGAYPEAITRRGGSAGTPSSVRAVCAGFDPTAATEADVQSSIPFERYDADAYFAPEPKQGRLTTNTRFGGFFVEAWSSRRSGTSLRIRRRARSGSTYRCATSSSACSPSSSSRRTTSAA